MYLVSMAIIGGARTVSGVMKVVKAGFMPLMKVCFLSVSPCGGILTFDYLGDLHQLASNANICTEVPPTGGRLIEPGASCYFSRCNQLWVPFFNMVAFTLGVSRSGISNQTPSHSLLFEDLLQHQGENRSPQGRP